MNLILSHIVRIEQLKSAKGVPIPIRCKQVVGGISDISSLLIQEDQDIFLKGDTLNLLKEVFKNGYEFLVAYKCNPLYNYLPEFELGQVDAYANVLEHYLKIKLHPQRVETETVVD